MSSCSDADTVCLRAWNPAQFCDGNTVVAVRDWIWRSGIQAEADSVSVPIEEYFLGCLLILNRGAHRAMLHAARDIYPQTSKLVQEQTALNAARCRLGLPLRFLDRRYCWSLFGRGNVCRVTAVNSITGDQTTKYVYGTTLSDSGIASSLLEACRDVPGQRRRGRTARQWLRRHLRPDGVHVQPAAAGTEINDQNGTVHAFDFDKLGRRLRTG